jgi:chloramphenicol O-acetyltransferase
MTFDTLQYSKRDKLTTSDEEKEAKAPHNAAKIEPSTNIVNLYSIPWSSFTGINNDSLFTQKRLDGR